MNFDDLDRRMRRFETVYDQCALPAVFLVARLDGRSFTRLTKELCDFDTPFDVRFRDMMLGMAEGVMSEIGFGVVYGYQQSDELSLLIAPDENAFQRKLRKLYSLLAAEASGRFSLALGRPAAFDCRISVLPTLELVVDYFRWRSEDAARNALSAHCYWMLRRQGRSAAQATAALNGRSASEKNELLFRSGLNFNDVPSWQKRGIGLLWEEREELASNPLTGESVRATRRRLCREMELPMREEYSAFLNTVLTP
jgi:tRNA(His) guanylyltransferase